MHNGTVKGIGLYEDAHTGKYCGPFNKGMLNGPDCKVERKSIYGDNIILPAMFGLDTISYYAEDRVGNVSKEEHLFVHMDNDAPTTNIEFGIPQFYKSQTYRD